MDENLKQLSDKFDSIQNTSDFVSLLNHSFSSISKKGNKNLFKFSSINYYAFHNNKRYKTFEIPKKNGNARQINAPELYLKLIQQCINIILVSKFKPHHTTHGFLPQRGIVSNAVRHIGKRYVLNIDLENFFESISFRRVKTVLGLSPFNLNDTREEIAFLIANLCCNDGFLPQGAPSSPILTNIVCQRLDRKMFQLAKINKVRYSRYADDLTFSSNVEVFSDEFMAKLNSIVQEEGFNLNNAKTRIRNWKERQEVTGLVVNQKVNVDRKYIRTIRAILNNYQKTGKENTQKIFVDHWSNKSQSPPSFEKSLKGKIEYLGMVRGKTDQLYLKYKKRYLELLSNTHIDYSFIKNSAVKNQLESDFKKMEQAQLSSLFPENEKFIEYSVYAFYQIEEMINYYFSTKMSLKELVSELITHTLLAPKSLKGKTSVAEIQISYKIFLFEKYFCYKPGFFYESIITKLRIIRNQKSHRYSSVLRSEEVITKEYMQLLMRIEDLKKTSPSIEHKMNYKERHLENEYNTIKFLNDKNYMIVFEAVKNVVEILKSVLNKQTIQ